MGLIARFPIAVSRQVVLPTGEEMENAEIARGSLFMGASVVFFATHALLIKQLYVEHGISPWQTLWFRFFVGVIVTAAVFGPRGDLKALRIFHHRLLILRGVFGVFGTALYYYSIPHIGAGIATLIGCSYVPFSILLAVWLLRERLTIWRGVWVAITFVGLALLSRSDGAGMPPVEPRIYFMALSGGLFAACVVVAIRKLHRTESIATIFWAQCAWGVLLTAPILYFVWKTPSPAVWGLLGLMGLLASLGQLFMTAGFRHLSVAAGSGFQMGLPVLATLGGVAFLGEHLIALQWFGAALVVFGTWQTVRVKR